jgi:predicted hydrocarbon binding protein
MFHTEQHFTFLIKWKIEKVPVRFFKKLLSEILTKVVFEYSAYRILKNHDPCNLPGRSKPVCSFRYGNFEACTFAGYAVLGDRDSGN